MKKINNSEMGNNKVTKEKLKFDKGYWIKKRKNKGSSFFFKC